MKTKITEIKIVVGRDVILIEPTKTTWVIGGKSGHVPEKLAAKLFKTISSQADPYFELLKGAKNGDFKS